MTNRLTNTKQQS